MSNFNLHVDDVPLALDEIKYLLAVDGKVNMTNYIRAMYLINELEKLIDPSKENNGEEK